MFVQAVPPRTHEQGRSVGAADNINGLVRAAHHTMDYEGFENRKSKSLYFDFWDKELTLGNLVTFYLLDMWVRGQHNAERGETPMSQYLKAYNLRVSKDFDAND